VPVEQSLEISAALAEHYHRAANGRLRFVMIPRFAICCPGPSMDRLALFADSGGYLKTTHNGENPHEVSFTEQVLFSGQGTYTQIYRDHGFLDKRSIHAHCIYFSDPTGDLRMFVDSGAKMAHCPTSNTALNSGMMELRRLLNMGISVGLGSDISGGPDLSMLRVGRAAREVAKLRRTSAFQFAKTQRHLP
jgi:guanine deaminase